MTPRRDDALRLVALVLLVLVVVLGLAVHAASIVPLPVFP